MNYAEKKQNRIERYRELSNKYKILSEKAHNQAHVMASVIPFGQPILIGHHSEKRDRAYRERIMRRFENCFKLQEKAEYYARKAQSAECNNAISSDASDAIEQIKEKIASLEQSTEHMKKYNKLLSKYKTRSNALIEIPKLEDSKEKAILLKMVENHYYAFPPDRINAYYFSTTNDGAEIRRLKERLSTLEKHANDETKEYIINDVKVVDNVEDNRLQLFFNGKPPHETISNLKRCGFKWSRYNGCWQRMRCNNAIYAMEQVLK